MAKDPGPATDPTPACLQPGAHQLGLDFGTGSDRSDPGDGTVVPGDVRRGAPFDDSWCQVARRLDPPRWWARYAGAGIGVTWPGQPDYPTALLTDSERPGVLFWRGELCHLRRPCVAIVGTRQATPDGRAIAFELGRDLAEVGICVVSGLALGIDGAAHAGALAAQGCSTAGEATGSAGPAGVAASGVDVPYPRRHTVLWERVVRAGVMLSETLPGRPAQAWRFPARNRVIAALASMVVVVESHAAGGSLITAEAAIARGIEVRVVPGPVHSSASAGSNQLMYDGPGPVRNAQDVLDGLGIFLPSPAKRPGRSGSPTPQPGLRTGATTSEGRRSRFRGERDADGLGSGARTTLEAVAWRPTSLSQVVDRTGLAVGAASEALDRLEMMGLVDRTGQWWVRRSRRR